MMIGAGLGALGYFGCWLMGRLTSNSLIIMMPMMIALGVAIGLGLHHRKFGYTTGVILAPFLLIIGLCLLMLPICGAIAIGSLFTSVTGGLIALIALGVVIYFGVTVWKASR